MPIIIHVLAFVMLQLETINMIDLHFRCSIFIFQIKLDPALESSKEEDSNILVLPTGKRKSKPVIDNTKKVKQLSKKERKRLENILERKKKKAHVRF